MATFTPSPGDLANLLRQIDDMGLGLTGCAFNPFEVTSYRRVGHIR